MPILPHPTRMVFEALRLRGAANLTTHQLFETIHQLYPSAPQDIQKAIEISSKPQVLHGITIPATTSLAPYQGHPVQSVKFLKNHLLPYLRKAGVIQQTLARKQVKTSGQSNYFWQFHPFKPVKSLPTALPASELSPSLLTTPSLLSEIDVDGLPPMPAEWDTLRNPRLGEHPAKKLALTVHKWQSNPLLSSDSKPKRGGLPWKYESPVRGERDQVVWELKKFSGLSRKRQRTRVDRVLEFRRWVDLAEGFWAKNAEQITEKHEGLKAAREEWESQRHVRRELHESGGVFKDETIKNKVKAFRKTLKAERDLFAKELELAKMEAKGLPV